MSRGGGIRTAVPSVHGAANVVRCDVIVQFCRADFTLMSDLSGISY
ncbi:hypothetical protein TNCV_3727181, partial [Trichonephila clavipes]